MFRSALKRIGTCLRLLRQARPEQPPLVASRETARRLRHAIGVCCSGAYGSGGNRNIDDVVSKEFASGHEKARKKAPPPRAR